MKTFTTLMLMCLLYNISYSQTVTPPIPLYHPDFANMERMLDKSNQQYEGGFNKVQKDYNVLMNLWLFNKENLAVLNGFRDYTKSKLKNSNQIDFSIDTNVQWALNIINDYLTIKPIADEIRVLNIIGKEISGLKASNPGSFTSTDRYKELIALIPEIENCHAEQITTLAWKHGLM